MKFFPLSLFLLLICGPFVAANAAEHLPLEYFVKHGDYLDLKLSPDGKHLAATMRRDKKVIAVVIRREDGEIVGGVQPQTNDAVFDVIWASNERLLYHLAEKEYYLDQPIPTGELYAINIDGSHHEIIYGYRAGDKKLGSRKETRKSTKASHEILSLLRNEPKHILLLEHPWELDGNTYYNRGNKKPIISKLNIYTGKKFKQEALPYPGASAVANERGEVNFIAWGAEDSTYHGSYRANNTSEWKTLTLEAEDQAALVPTAVNRSGTKAFLMADTGADEISTMFELNVASGALQPVFANLEFDLESYGVNPDDLSPVIGVTRPDREEYHYVDETTAISKYHKMLVKGFKGQDVAITDHSEDGKLLLVYVSSDINPGEYYLFDTKTKRADLVVAQRSWVDPEKMHARRAIKVQARDGLQLHGYLTLPASQAANKKDKQAHPLVVIPHGGPHGIRDYWTFDAEAQLFANRGYAVLQINFRGSGGYGQKFTEAGYREWGGKMIDDIIDATQWTVDKGYADADRICIYGASFGGYAALMSAVKAPALFQCTVGYVGIYDLEYAFSKSDVPDNRGGEGYLQKALGGDKQQLQDYSPVNHADKITAAVMLIHGGKDKRVPVVNAKAMRKRLKKAGKSVEWLLFRNAGHGVWNQKSLIKMYSEVLEFLDQHIGSK